MGWSTRAPWTPLCRWVPRDLTAAADLACNIVMDEGRSYSWLHADAMTMAASGAYSIRFVGDGACREARGVSAYASFIFLKDHLGEGIFLIGYVGVFLPFRKPAWLMELAAIRLGTKWIAACSGLGPVPAAFQSPPWPSVARGLLEDAAGPWLE